MKQASAMSTCKRDILVVFPSSLGWMALMGSGKVLKQLTFGHASSKAAVEALDTELAHCAGGVWHPHMPPSATRPAAWNQPLVRRLQAYASGCPDDFLDVEIDPGPQTDFRRRVIRCCRQIPFGKTLTYGQLAAQAGSPGAARAVGRCMAANRIPLVIPCHRVVAAKGGLGGYSAPGGISTKRRLLELERGKLP